VALARYDQVLDELGMGDGGERRRLGRAITDAAADPASLTPR